MGLHSRSLRQSCHSFYKHDDSVKDEIWQHQSCADVEDGFVARFSLIRMGLVLLLLLLCITTSSSSLLLNHAVETLKQFHSPSIRSATAP